MWTWQYNVSAVLRKHESTDPCNETVSCPLQDRLPCGTRYLDAADNSTLSEDISKVQVGVSVRMVCDTGYSGSGVFECTDSCIFSPPLQKCSEIVCRDITNAKYGFDFASAMAGTVDFKRSYHLSEAIHVQCPKGYMLDLSSEKSAGFEVEGLSGTLPVVASQTFGVPPADVESNYVVRDEPGFKIKIPAGAWPESDARLLKLTILDLKGDKTIQQSLKSMGGAELIGKGIYFQPTGITFARPVEISIPYDPLVANNKKEVSIYRLNSATGVFQKVPLSTQRPNPIDNAARTIYAETRSFSLYAPLAVLKPDVALPAPAPKPSPPAATSTVATSAPKELPGKNVWTLPVIIGVAAGGGLFLLFVFILSRRLLNRSQPHDPPYKDISTLSQRGVSIQEARTEQEPSHPRSEKNAAVTTPEEIVTPAPQMESGSRNVQLPRSPNEATPEQLPATEAYAPITPITPNAPISTDASMQESSPLDSFSVAEISRYLHCPLAPLFVFFISLGEVCLDWRQTEAQRGD